LLASGLLKPGDSILNSKLKIALDENGMRFDAVFSTVLSIAAAPFWLCFDYFC
jgi:hypothetical protein